MTVAANPADVDAYVAGGWWERSLTLSDLVRTHATERPSSIAYRWGTAELSWAAYDELADGFAAVVAALCSPGDRVLVWLPDGGAVHAGYLGCERANAVTVGVGWRAGRQELAHLVSRTGATIAIMPRETPHGPGAELAATLGLEPVIVDDVDRCPKLATTPTGPVPDSGIGPSELWLLNSTSGTTGLPKCVMQTQNRWFYFHQKAVAAGGLGDDEVWMSVVPAPFGFGLWTAHVTPALLGAPCHVQPRFDAEAAAAAIEKYSITVLCAVSSQFVMILDAAGDRDISSLRAVFTGGEAISPSRAAELEERAGCRVLNFYGSNETGVLSGTTIVDPRDRRHTTGGRVIPEMQVRLYDPDTGDRLPDQGEGQPACRGPALALGYWDDPDANAVLATDDGWYLMGDLVRIEEGGWLTVVGRTSDIVIRGGKNISAPAVEEEVATHAAVALVAVVGAPHPRLGETAVAYVQVRPGHTLTLEDLKAHLHDRGVTIDWWPEEVVVMDELPMSSGGKVAKGELRRLAAQRATNPTQKIWSGQ
ncbi:MAG: class I adenylate-forming enzyme family protein [Acidimicrobiales bacterium]